MLLKAISIFIYLITAIFADFYIFKNFNFCIIFEIIENNFFINLKDVVINENLLSNNIQGEPLDIFCVVYDYNVSLIFNNISLQMFFDFFLFIFIFKILYFNIENFKNYNFYFLKSLYYFV